MLSPPFFSEPISKKHVNDIAEISMEVHSKDLKVVEKLMKFGMCSPDVLLSMCITNLNNVAIAIMDQT